MNRPVLLSAQQAGTDSPDAAREELRAEIGALMTGVRTGLGHRPRHGEIYTERWIQLIESDPRELVGAAAAAWRMSESLLDGARKLEESRAETPSGRPGVREAPRIRIRRGDPVPSSPPRPALGPPPPAPGAGVLKRFGWRGAEAEWIALVCRHSGLFTRSQFCAYFHCRRNCALRFVRRLLRRGHGVQEDLYGLPTTTRPCRIHCPDLYRVLGLHNPRHRRTASPTVLFRRLLSLDYVLEHPDRPWLPTEREKIQALEALRIPRRIFPRRRYYGRAQGQSRYFPLKLPLALDGAQATFVYCDPGRDSDQELLSWGAAHAWLWTALRQADRRVRVIAVTRNPARQQRARMILRRWTRPGPGARFQPLTPDEKDNIRGIEQALQDNDRQYLAKYGGWIKALNYRQRLLERPKTLPTKDRIRIDRGRTWISSRIPRHHEI